MDALVCETLEDYAALARALAADPARRAALRDRLIAARDTAPLFDAHAFARGLESAYTKMAERARAGGAPALIRVLLPAASGLNS
jgi:predicted O-linked N-acetylglucosamine transferase (SPINDLY family)